jgi:protein gp37
VPDPDLPSELQEHYEILGQWDGVCRRVGKKAAGRKLDGITWDEFPASLPAST